jgi:hypothetical protein
MWRNIDAGGSRHKYIKWYKNELMIQGLFINGGRYSC